MTRGRSHAATRSRCGGKAPVCGIALAIAATGFSHAQSDINPYAHYSDAELAGVAAHWQQLDTDARRDFFIEMRRRIEQDGQSMAIPVRVERRFGRIVRRPDGSVVRIERVIRIHSRGKAPAEYGSGFEKRMGGKPASWSAPKGKALPNAAPRQPAKAPRAAGARNAGDGSRRG